MDYPVFIDDDLPGRGTRGPYWAPRLRPLMNHPLRWAILDVRDTSTSAYNLAMYLRRANLPEGKWEFATRTLDGEHRVYGRYLGPEEV